MSNFHKYLNRRLGYLFQSWLVLYREDWGSVAGLLRFFENGGTYTETQQMVFKHLRITTRKQILGVLVKQPSAGRDEIAGLLGFTGATITWHMKLLEADRIIAVQRKGRIVRYVIPDNVNCCLNDYLSA